MKLSFVYKKKLFFVYVMQFYYYKFFGDYCTFFAPGRWVLAKLADRRLIDITMDSRKQSVSMARRWYEIFADFGGHWAITSNLIIAKKLGTESESGNTEISGIIKRDER